MAYSRGLVAGFEIDSIDDLIYFANAFGATRLRYELELLLFLLVHRKRETIVN